MCNRFIKIFTALICIAAIGCAEGEVLEPAAGQGETDAEAEAEDEGSGDEVEVDRSGGKSVVAGGETSGETATQSNEQYAGVQECIADGCAVETEACQQDDDCGAIYICILECANDISCVDGCIELDVEDFGTPVGDLASCVAKVGCLDAPVDSQGESQGEEGVEEDEAGEEGEGGPGGGFGEGGFGEGGDDIANAIQCVFEECGPELEECFADPECSKVVECLTTCGADTGCLENCGVSLDASLLGGATGAVVTCGLGAGCIDLGGFDGESHFQFFSLVE